MTAPTFTVPADITIATDYNCAYNADPMVTGSPTAVNDNCTAQPTSNFTDYYEQGQCEGSGAITRIWTVTDACGKTATATQTITVQDHIRPTLSVISGDTSDILVIYGNVPPVPEIVASDNCTTNVNLAFTEIQDGSPCDPRFTITRTWTATDCSGNSTQITQVISIDFTLLTGSIAANQTICSGATPAPLTSTSAGSGYGTITYRWEKKTDLNGTWMTIIGATGATYAPGALTDTTCYQRFLVVALPGNITCESVASNVVAINVQPLTPVSVTISSADLDICAGEPITFTATVINGGVNPTYVWKKNGNTVATIMGTNLYTTQPLVFPGDNNAVFTVEITPGADIICPAPLPAVSNGLQIQVNPVGLPVLTLSANQTLICPGETVHFSLMVTNADINSSLFIWKVNDILAVQGFGLITYSSNTLPNGANVQVTIIPLLDPCGALATAVSNTVTITYKPQTVPSVNMMASAIPICPGGNVTFTATPANGGISPMYQWLKNNISVGTNSPVYTAINPQNSDVIKVMMTPSAEICTNPLTAVSAPITTTLYPAAVVTITGLAPAYCQNAASVTLTGTPPGGTFTIDGNAATVFNPGALSLGSHLVQYSATDNNGCSGSTIKTVVIQQPVVANAGPDQTGGTATFTMAANAATPGTGMWTVVSGTVTINNASSPTTAVTIVTGTTAVLRWTITNGSCVTFDDVMITRNGVKVQLRAFLQGTYAADQGKMRDNLRQLALIPKASPYGTGQTTTATVLAVSGTNAIVDWVKVEIRDATNHSNILATTSALIQVDGDIVDVDGVSTVPFNSIAPGNYFVAIKHRNHLGIMTANAIPLTIASPLYNFTLSATAAFKNPMVTNNPMALMIGRYCMWGGDVNGDAIVRYSGLSNDNTALLQGCLGGNPALVIPNVYSNCDLNMNGNVRYSGPSNDNTFLLQTILGSNAALILSQHF